MDTTERMNSMNTLPPSPPRTRRESFADGLSVRIPALVVWGESDGVADPDYGRAYAQSLPNARFELIPEAGHLPQIEQPERLLTLVWEFANSITATPPVAGSSEKR